MNHNLYRYPQQAVLRDGRRVTLRPFQQSDVSGLHDFFVRLPHQLQSFAWDRIESRSTIEAWGASIDYSKVFPLLAFDGARVVADATLHRRSHGPLRLVGRLRWLIDPEFRAVGLGSILVNHLIDSARANGLRHLSCLLIRDLEADAIETLNGLGFEARHIAGYGTDPDGGEHDMTLLVLRL